MLFYYQMHGSSDEFALFQKNGSYEKKKDSQM